MDLHFDYVEETDTVLLGVVMVEDFSVILQEQKRVPKVDGENFYHWGLAALDFGLDLLMEDDVELVVLKNQQQLLFSWLEKGTYKENYAGYYVGIEEKMGYLVESGSKVEYEKIKGSQNRAKKFIKKNTIPRVTKPVTGDLTSRFAGTGSKVIAFKGWGRKEA